MRRETAGQAIFEEIRDMPYRLAEFPGDAAPNCAVKGRLLLERLGFQGFTLRGRIAEMDWNNTLFPEEIVALYPRDINPAHFYRNSSSIVAAIVTHRINSPAAPYHQGQTLLEIRS